MDYKNFLEESAAELYEQAPCGYLSFLPDGTIVKVNQTFLNWLLCKKEDLLHQKKINDLLSSCSQELYITDLVPLLNSQGFASNFNLDFITAHGSLVPTHVNITQIKDQQGTPQVNRATIINITDQKKYEQELLAAKQKAEEASKVKTDFISTLSHEIRTPLNAIIGVTNLLIKNESPEQTGEFLEVLKYSSESLLNLINDILDLSKMEAGRAVLNEKSFRIRQMVRQIGLTQNIKATEKGIAVQVRIDEKIPGWLLGDEIKIGQVLTNLVSNAVKFTQQGYVRLQLNLESQENEYYDICFRVIDTGIGIPPERIETIFEEFTQASTETSVTYGGTGLGLTISKRILDLYGSKISVESKLGAGTEFSFNLKLKKGTPVTGSGSAQPSPRQEEEVLKGVKLLLVEDSKVNSLVVEQYLKNWGVDFAVARNGLQAIAKITQYDYEVVLMDLQMPILDGYEATRWVRSLPQTKYQRLPIIALSAANETSLQAAGLTDYINKPFKPEDLFTKIALHSKRKV